MLKEFKAFVMKGNVIDLAVAVVLGVAFGAVIVSRLRAARVDRESVAAAAAADGPGYDDGSRDDSPFEAELEFDDEPDDFAGSGLAGDLPDEDLDDDTLADSAPRGPRPRD